LLTGLKFGFDVEVSRFRPEDGGWRFCYQFDEPLIVCRLVTKPCKSELDGSWAMAGIKEWQNEKKIVCYCFF